MKYQAKIKYTFNIQAQIVIDEGTRVICLAMKPFTTDQIGTFQREIEHRATLIQGWIEAETLRIEDTTEEGLDTG